MPSRKTLHAGQTLFSQPSQLQRETLMRQYRVTRTEAASIIETWVQSKIFEADNAADAEAMAGDERGDDGWTENRLIGIDHCASDVDFNVEELPADQDALKAFFEAVTTPEAEAVHELDCAARAYAVATVPCTDTDDPTILEAEQEAFIKAVDRYKAGRLGEK